MNSTTPRTALVTGAASGIGLAISTRLVAAGYQVAMLDINEVGLHNARAQLGPLAMPVPCDLSDYESLLAAVKTVEDAFGTLDVLINNAGVVTPGTFETSPPAAISRDIGLNLIAPIRVTHAVLKFLKRPGSIVNTVSMAGILPLKDEAVYTASKFGLRGFTLTLATELRSSGIRVSGVFPSGVQTPMLEHEMKNGGSVLNYLSPPVPPDAIAALAMRAIKEGKLEYYARFSDGLSCRLALAFPWIFLLLYPYLEREGAAAQRKFLAKKTS